MHELARFLGEQRRTIISTAARLAPTPGADRLNQRFEELTAALDAGDASRAVFDAVILGHAKERRLEGSEVRDVVGEYQALRRAMLDVYTRPGTQPSLNDLLVFNELVDRGIAAWVDYFAAQCDHVRDTLAWMGDGLRAPLEAISASSRILLRSRLVDADTVGKVSADVLTSAQQMTDLIDGMFGYARAHLRRGIVLERREIDLAAICRVAVEEVNATDRGRWIELKELEPGADFTTVADRMRLAQAVKNLVRNAIENYEDPIVLACVDERDSLRVDVTSAGSLREGIAGRVFQPFAPSGIRNGPGLGLFLVAEIARAHDGTAWMTAHERRVQVSFRIAKQPG